MALLVAGIGPRTAALLVAAVLLAGVLKIRRRL